MVNCFSLSMDLPSTLLDMASHINNVSANDMLCGGMKKQELLAFRLRDISAKVGPYIEILYSNHFSTILVQFLRIGDH